MFTLLITDLLSKLGLNKRTIISIICIYLILVYGILYNFFIKVFPGQIMYFLFAMVFIVMFFLNLKYARRIIKI